MPDRSITMGNFSRYFKWQYPHTATFQHDISANQIGLTPRKSKDFFNGEIYTVTFAFFYMTIRKQATRRHFSHPPHMQKIQN